MNLQDLFSFVMPSLAGMEPTCSLVKAVNLTHNAIISRLTQIRSDVLVEEALIDIAAGDGYGYLPDEFISLSRRPQIVGGGFMTVLPTSDTSNMEIPATPRYYLISGRLLQVYPPPDVDITLKMLARMRPAEPVMMTDDFPFSGLFDQVYIDGVISVLSGGVDAMNAKKYLPGIQMQIDQILSGAAGDNEQVMADSINGL